MMEQNSYNTEQPPDFGRVLRVAAGGMIVFVAVILIFWLVWQISTILYEPNALPLVEGFETGNPLDNAFFMPEGYVVIVPPNAFRLLAYMIVAGLLGIVSRLTLSLLQAGLSTFQDKPSGNNKRY